jgi:hypothetical protein
MPRASAKVLTTESPVLLADGHPDTPYYRFIQRRNLQANLLKKTTAQEQLAARMRSRLDVVQEYLADDEVWYTKLEKSNLRDLAIMEGIWIDKLQLLEGKATQVISHQHQEKLDELLPVLLETLKQRGLTIGLSERRLEIGT